MASNFTLFQAQLLVKGEAFVLTVVCVLTSFMFIFSSWASFGLIQAL